MNESMQIASIKNLREIASEYNARQINQCIYDQIDKQSNNCKVTGENTEVVNALARAGVIRQLIDNGASLAEATRELGRRMRSAIAMNS